MVDSQPAGGDSRFKPPLDPRFLMPQPTTDGGSLHFGTREGEGCPFEMNLRSGQLLKHGVRVNLQGQPFEALRLLVERAQARPSDIVTRDEIVKELWHGEYIDDPEARVNGLIRRIRIALDDSTVDPRFVETLPKRGYRFLGRVEPLPAPAPVPQPSAVSAGRIRSIAVLPFNNLCGDPSQEYFVYGMTDLLTSRLAQIQGLRVPSFLSATISKNTGKAEPEIARDLGVDAVVEGSVLRSQKFIRITAQLIDGPTDTHLWAKTYERTLEDAWALQSEVALDIAAEIQIHLSPLRAPQRTVTSEATEAYFWGRHFWNKRSESALKRAIEYFRQAILENANYAEAHAGMADCYNMLAWNSMRRPSEVLPRARHSALEALKIDDLLAEAHSSLAFDLLFQDWNWKGAEEEFRRSIEMNPNYGVVRPWLAFELSALGRKVEACAEAKRAVRIDPVAAPILVSAGLVYYLAGDYDTAIRYCEKVLHADPDSFYQAYFIVGMARERKDLFGEAVEALKVCVDKSRLQADNSARPSGDPNAHMLAALGFCLARSGAASEAMQIILELKEIQTRKYVAPFNLAMVYAGLGQKDATLEWLEKAYDDHSMWLIFVNSYPIFDFLRSDPRFQDLVRRMGFTS